MENNDILLTEIKKLDKKLDKVEKSFKLTEEIVKLGAIDTTILTLMIFIVAVGFSFISWGVPKLPQNNLLLPIITIVYGYFLVLIIPIIYAIISYSITIFKKEGRFTNKRITLTIVTGTALFVVGVWGLAILFIIIETISKNPLSKNLVEIFLFTWLILVVILSFVYINPKIKEYFETELPQLHTLRKKEIEKNKEIVLGGNYVKKRY